MRKEKYDLISNFKFMLWNSWRIDKRIIIGLLLLIPINVLISIIQIYVPKLIVDSVSRNQIFEDILIMIISISCIWLVLEFLKNKINCFTDIKSEYIVKFFNLSFMEKISNISLEVLESNVGQIGYHKARNSLSEYGVFGYLDSCLNFLMNIAGFITYIGIISQLNWVIIPILIGLELIGGIVALIVQNQEQKIKGTRADIDRKINYVNNISKDFIAAKDIRLYTMTQFLLERGKKLIVEKKFWNNKQYRYFFIENCTSVLISLLITGGTYIYLLFLLVQKELTVGDIVLYLGAILGFSTWLSGIVSGVDMLGRTNKAVKDMRQFLDIAVPNINVSKEEKYEFNSRNIITLKNLVFKYPESDSVVINDVNLEIKEGEKIAIVGLNGAGKTTLIKLILGFYTPSDGEIFYKSTPIKNLDVTEIFSVVFQDTKFLPISILENICVKPQIECNEEKVWEILQLVGLERIIKKLPKGIFTPLNTSLNKDAQQFSGGEFQKLAMARAIYKDSEILILDEPTASLDPIAENQIYQKYNDITSNKTTIFISHRLASTKFCDRILFLEQGKIVEQGTHDELMKINGKYADLFNIQSKYYKKKDDNSD